VPLAFKWFCSHVVLRDMKLRRRILFSPGQLLRQAGSVVLYGVLVHWRFMPRWLCSGLDLLGLVAGSEGMGCIGFPVHPVVEVTRRCNLRCIQCHAESSDVQQEELSFEQMRKLLRELAAQPEFKMVVFSGGEPLLRDDIVELCEYASGWGLWPVIATNGTLLDAALARRLRRAGVCGVAVGLDGDCPAVHDEIRGEQGAFARAIEGCIAAREAGIPLQINTTLMQPNYRRFAEIVRLSENLGARVMLAYFVSPCGRGLHNSGIMLTPEQYESMLIQIARLQRHSRLIIEPTCAPNYWAMLGASNWPSSLAVRLLGPAFFHGCVAGTGLLYVRADGEALACPFLPISAGNVVKTTVSKLWREGEIFKSLRALKREPTAERCSNCRFYDVCGGCRARAFWAQGDFAAEDPFCFLGDNDQLDQV